MPDKDLTNSPSDANLRATPEPDENSSRLAEQDVNSKDFEVSPDPREPTRSRKSSLEAIPPSREGTPPPLPPRPKNVSRLESRLDDRPKTSGSLAAFSLVSRPPLQGNATTAVSRTDVHTQSAGEHDTHSSPDTRRMSFPKLGRNASRNASRSHSGSDRDDSLSVRSLVPTLAPGADIESLMDGMADQSQSAVSALTPHIGIDHLTESLFADNLMLEKSFLHEFDELEEIKADGSNEGQETPTSWQPGASANFHIYLEQVVLQWKSKLKHFLILSSAGKPIWSRHGDDQLITNYMGVVQTIISFYQGANDDLRGFTAGDVRFVVMSKGSLNLVAISRIGESDTQLRAQLEALYMQILSTLTLRNMERMFSNRPSYDLRRPLQGTEVLLSALADGFTRGSPSTLLSALECLRLRKTHRQVVNNTFLKARSSSLLYGLIVAGGRLVSVVRPKRHSLHPGDLHLIFNMLFEAGSVKAGGGENWIPLCLPGFNNTGYLYMYVSFLSASDWEHEILERPSSSGEDDDEVAIILISANKEGFFELRNMRDDLVQAS